MRVGRTLLIVGWSAWLASFLMPTSPWAPEDPRNMLGFDAFRYALIGVSTYHVLSALTNVAMAISTFVLWMPSRVPRLILFVSLTASFALNLSWRFSDQSLDQNRSEGPLLRDHLLIGYYLWIASFLIVAAGLWMLLRAERREIGS